VIVAAWARAGEIIMSRHTARHTVSRIGRFRAITSTLTSAVMVITFATLLTTQDSANAQTATIPSNFVAVVDSGGANDQNQGQSDMTRMGRDDSDASYYQLFWSWDATDFSAENGTACALFDSDGDGNINFAVCAEVHNVGTTVQQIVDSPVAVTCTDAKPDRCTIPGPEKSFTPSQLSSGDLFDHAGSPTADLVTETDPFSDLKADQNWPNDTSIWLKIAKSFLPTGAELANVCSYPSIGSDGNADPKDCVLAPSSGLMKITKVAPNSTTQTFSFTVNPGGITKTLTGSSTTDPFPLQIGSGYSVSETVPSGWHLDSAACTLESGASTGTPGSTGVTGVTVESGKVTTCTFTDTVKPSVTVTKSNDATHDGTYNDKEEVGAGASYPYSVTYEATIKNPSLSSAKIDSISDDKAAAPLSTANQSLTSCSSLIGTDIAAGATKTCYYDVTFAGPVDDVTNTVSVTLKNSAGSDTATDTSTVTFVKTPELTLDKTADRTSFATVGDVISYSYELTNSGNVTLSEPFTVSDDMVTVTCPTTPTSLAPGDSITCTSSYTIKQSDLDAGSVKNTATGHGFFGTTKVDSNQDTVTVNAAKLPALSIVKSATPSIYDSVGDVIAYSYAVKNTGNVTLFDITVTDDKASVTCPDTSTGLVPQASVTCTASYPISQADLDAGSVTNTAYAKSGDTESNKDTETVTAQKLPALTIVKTATPSTYETVGEVIAYSYEVTNTGNVTLFDITVTDDKASVTCPDTSAGLAPQASLTCTASYPVSQADLDAGSVTNTAYAKSGDTESNKDSETVSAVPDATLMLDKSASPSTYAALGDVISYEYVLTNSGNVTLNAPFTVSDDRADDEACPATPTSMAPGESITCTASYLITQADLDSGSVTNTALAHGTFQDAVVDSNYDSATVNAQKQPGLSIVKTATPSTYKAVGDVIGYSYEVTNTGNVTLFDITVTDDKASVTCPDTSTGLAPNAAITCTASYPITQADLDAGSVTNTAYAQAGNTTSDPDSETVTAQKLPALWIDKTASPITYSAVGEVIAYSYVVTNTGNVTLYGITVLDDRATVTCPDTSTGLAPNAAITCTATSTITQSDLDAGSVVNTAHATDGSTVSNEDSETVTAQKLPALSIVKAATPSTYSAVGDVIAYSYVVTNTGNVTLYGITVLDDKATVTCPPEAAQLAPQASVTCDASYAITQSDLDAGSVTNTAYATDGTIQSPPDSETVNADQSPALSIDKTASPVTYAAVGDVIAYSYVVTNTGNVTLFGITVADDKATVTCPDTSTGLAPNAAITCTASYPISQADLDAGSVTNTAYAKAGDTESNKDTETVTAQKLPALAIDKQATPSTYNAVGDVIAYSYLVTNTGNVTLYGITVTDDKAAVSCPPDAAVMAPNASVTCNASYVITQQDLDSGAVTNTAYATDGSTMSNEDSETVTALQDPALKLVKTATPSTYKAVGAVISYSYTLTNIGNVTLDGPFTVIDDKATATCELTPSLAPSASITCGASYAISQSDLDAGSVMNIATGHGSFNGKTVDSNPDTATVTAAKLPALSIDKTATPSTYNAVGQIISYSYLVTNTGNVTLYGITVADDKATVTCPDTSTGLAPNAAITCTATYPISQADLDAGSVTNTAYAKAGDTESNRDSETVNAEQQPALTLDKTATPSTYNAVGQIISYSYLVTNTGNVTLFGITVADDKATVTCPDTSTGLAPNAAITCTATYPISQADLDAGSVTNTAYAKAGDTESNRDSETVNAEQQPALTLDKTANPSTYKAVGDAIAYSYKLTNTGNVTLSGPFTVSDDKATVTCPATATLAPAAFITCSASYPVTQKDLDAGSVVNTATGRGSFNGKTVDSNKDSETVTAVQSPALTLVKTASPTVYEKPGDVIAYSYELTNTGNVTLSGPFTVSDDKATVTCPATATLAPAAFITCSASYTITQSDLDAGLVTNTAQGQGLFGTTTVTSNQDDETVWAVSGLITPTNTTCSMFASRIAEQLSAVQYSTKGTRISSVNPGVLFDWVKVTDGGTYTITQTLSANKLTTPFTIAAGSAVWDGTCTKVQNAKISQLKSGAVTVQFTGTGTFYIGIKYGTASVLGKSPAPPTVTYTFTATKGTVEVHGSAASVDLVPKFAG
jgi:uncharacterized repeat protein (TIGR01451 family)